MSPSSHNQIVSFIWSIADDCLRDVYVRGKYRDVILPMTVLRRLDALLESSKADVLEEVRLQTEEMELPKTELIAEDLQAASGYVFYNISNWTLQEIAKEAPNSQQLLLANVEEYLRGFSANVQEIIQKFNLYQQVEHLAKKNVLLEVIQKFTSPSINLSPQPLTNTAGETLPGLSNLGMGYVFEELIRKFNEENNEEAGEHFTPREVIELMTQLVFMPVKDNLQPVITIYDPACGSGGMLTESQNFISDPKGSIQAQSRILLYGKEINDETYAICKSDMMIKGNSPENIRNGSTLASDEFAKLKFDFMLSNPPYGKSWKTEQKYIKDGKEVIDPRFVLPLSDYWGQREETGATPRSSDGQLLFLMEMVHKMKRDPNSQGSRIASVHNGSSLFTGDAGSGESDIRRYIIENDWLEGIIQLPQNLFYNTGITTYIWLLSNRKAPERQGKVILIDASQRYQKLRKNLGAKNCELSPAHIQEILQTYSAMSDIEADNSEGLSAKVFANSDFGYYKIPVERPQRLRVVLSEARIEGLRYYYRLEEPMRWLYQKFGEQVYTAPKELADALAEANEEKGWELTKKQLKQCLSLKRWKQQREYLAAARELLELGDTANLLDFNAFEEQAKAQWKEAGLQLTAAQRKAIFRDLTEYDAEAAKVMAKRLRLKGKKKAALLAYLRCTEAELPLFGYFPAEAPDTYVQYESETDLRDYENIPLRDSPAAYFQREVQPHLPEAWLDLESIKIGYEISFNKYFYRHAPLRPLDEVEADILALEQENEGLIMDILQKQ